MYQDTLPTFKTMTSSRLEQPFLETTKNMNHTYGRSQRVSISYRELTPELSKYTKFIGGSNRSNSIIYKLNVHQSSFS